VEVLGICPAQHESHRRKARRYPAGRPWLGQTTATTSTLVQHDLYQAVGSAHCYVRTQEKEVSQEGGGAACRSVRGQTSSDHKFAVMKLSITYRCTAVHAFFRPQLIRASYGGEHATSSSLFVGELAGRVCEMPLRRLFRHQQISATCFRVVEVRCVHAHAISCEVLHTKRRCTLFFQQRTLFFQQRRRTTFTRSIAIVISNWAPIDACS